MRFLYKRKLRLLFQLMAYFVIWVFSASFIIVPSLGEARSVLNLPIPGTMVFLSPTAIPPILKGMIIDPENPFFFDFILDHGNSNLAEEAINQEAMKFIKYFLASLAMPENELWVNLSPYEKDRIMSESFSLTDMGRDLLAQDYLLKQLTASLIYPKNDLGEKFWDRVYQKAKDVYGSSEVSVNTFNKIWIIPEKASVYENKDSVFIVKSHLKVMMEEDYLALNNHFPNGNGGQIYQKKGRLNS